MTDGSAVVRSTRKPPEALPGTRRPIHPAEARVGSTSVPVHLPRPHFSSGSEPCSIFQKFAADVSVAAQPNAKIPPQPAVSGIQRKHSVASVNPQAIGLFRAVGCSRYAWSNVDGMLTLKPALPRTQVCYIGTGLRARCQQ